MPDITLPTLSITPVSPAIGARVTGLDLTRPLSDAEAAALQRALVTHQVLFFEDQPLTPQTQRAFAARFGDLHIHPVYPNVPEQPEIMVLDTGPHNPTDNDVWHTDVTCIETPPAIVALAGKRIPPSGGDTVWASNIAAYAALSEPLKRLLEPLSALHDFTKSFPEWRHNGDPETHARWRAARDRHPPVVHPVVRVHPVSGARALFVNENFTARIVGLSDRESAAILGFLFDHISRPEFTVRWQWKPDDLVLWDNRSTQHYAVNDYLPHSRLMHRATVLGDRPVGP
ncbi:taurine dioxygenase (plasmid) [Azospirillum brasilense]|uniref:Taurine dioxygenase n=1 Tax=Azospirillum brasilense TaxID=192 RepID=A0A4D8RIX1_AZOBR|nr:taurine dioxygenase [Azospirillum brasilense]QCO19359.1 taurine dioxygenase [Azospirillum brasilense]